MMSGVRRYQTVLTLLGEALKSVNSVVLSEDFDRVAAERDALQLRLNEADQRNDDYHEERQKLIAYGRNCGLDEAATLCNKMAWEAYYPPGTRFKFFTPKAQAALGDLLIKAANAIASLPDGPYDRFKTRQQKSGGTSAAA
ncbi:hypothetical protein PS914_05999 [Pseudomonas fluorescens]|uniref:hypothetical protein n=1 Tax=Pseudomonas fluorescens TaxID=294 RepID=UPI001242BC92|nr:hypothetical protein [Pseudomonas fluorescens]VVQ17345.1 hypothetical protein PS914_05999 [Pseudomonas fluorescens]